jgi:hypothetical protein
VGLGGGAGGAGGGGGGGAAPRPTNVATYSTLVPNHLSPTRF